ncbi:DUF444 family protein [Candidatus Woesearchaeota archaeon]|nr:DUF444 family protein [Candidatus Woesearchaeota archaeon]
MTNRIDCDYERFKQIVRGRIKNNFKRYIINTSIYKVNGEKISIPVDVVEIPHFTYGKNKESVGQGEGDIGEIISRNTPEESAKYDAEFSVEEIAKILAEELDLPNLEEKIGDLLEVDNKNYTSISKSGPSSLRYFKKTFKEALKRAMLSREYDPKKPFVSPIKADERFRSAELKPKILSNALIIYLKDASGSMHDVINSAKNTAFWTNIWLSTVHKKISQVYIDYTGVAHEATKEQFFKIEHHGYTNMMSGLEECVKIIEQKYSPDLWNIYVMHFQDGDFTNCGQRNDAQILEYLLKNFLPKINAYFVEEFRNSFVYSPYYSDILREIMELAQGKKIHLAVVQKDPEHVINALKTFFGNKERYTKYLKA